MYMKSSFNILRSFSKGVLYDILRLQFFIHLVSRLSIMLLIMNNYTSSFSFLKNFLDGLYEILINNLNFCIIGLYKFSHANHVGREIETWPILTNYKRDVTVSFFLVHKSLMCNRLQCNFNCASKICSGSKIRFRIWYRFHMILRLT